MTYGTFVVMIECRVETTSHTTGTFTVSTSVCKGLGAGVQYIPDSQGGGALELGLSGVVLAFCGKVQTFISIDAARKDPSLNLQQQVVGINSPGIFPFSLSQFEIFSSPLSDRSHRILVLEKSSGSTLMILLHLPFSATRADFSILVHTFLKMSAPSVGNMTCAVPEVASGKLGRNDRRISCIRKSHLSSW